MAKKYNDPLVVAVTGGIGSGQSTVCEFFKKLNCRIINADLKAKEIINKDKKLQKLLAKSFGNHIFDKKGKLIPAQLAEVAFKDEVQTQRLNQLVHPRMVAGIIEEMEQARFSGRYPMVIIDAALIYEISIENMFDAIVVVTAPINERFERVRQRDNMSRNQFKQRMDRQIPLEQKAKWADYVINNDSTLEALEERTKAVFNLLLPKQKEQKKRPRRYGRKS